jgi:mannose-6-phosphate isomerase-like protein (cupin superfamily)
MKVKRKWGWYKILGQGDGYKVKILCVYPKKKSSLQRHKLRDEVWIYTNGREKGRVIGLRRNQIHQLTNQTRKNRIIVEVQLGKCHERDIERL